MRDLVEEVREPERFSLITPPVFAADSQKATDAGMADLSQAQNAIKDWHPDIGYVRKGTYWDDDKFPTRLDVSVEIVLVKRDDVSGDLVTLYCRHPLDGWQSATERLPSRKAYGVGLG